MDQALRLRFYDELASASLLQGETVMDTFSIETLRVEVQQCHISNILEMSQYLSRETPYLLREMPQLVWAMCISQAEGASRGKQRNPGTLNSLGFFKIL
jgi:hypothetical protein